MTTKVLTKLLSLRILEDDIHIAIDARTDALQTLRELGPPDLVHLVKQAAKSQKQVGLA